MKRRAFITLLASAAAWPFAARAQQAKRPIIGFLGTATPSTWGSFTAAFVQRLRELGWTDGGNITVEARWAEGRTERYAEIAAEFVRRKVDVIVTSGGAVPAAKQATSTIPIVFTLARDPVAAGWVASLARPGGQHHRPLGPDHRDYWQAARTLARDHSRSAPVGGHVQHGSPSCRAGNERGPGGGKRA
jgi:putative tryptophan/tyrosine transport system substrate-binding protein